jgi:hypothetical protein
MRPDKSIAKRSDRDLDLAKLWKELGEDPPGRPGDVGSLSSPKGAKRPRQKKAS